MLNLRPKKKVKLGPSQCKNKQLIAYKATKWVCHKFKKSQFYPRGFKNFTSFQKTLWLKAKFVSGYVCHGWWEPQPVCLLFFPPQLLNPLPQFELLAPIREREQWAVNTIPKLLFHRLLFHPMKLLWHPSIHLNQLLSTSHVGRQMSRHPLLWPIRAPEDIRHSPYRPVHLSQLLTNARQSHWWNNTESRNSERTTIRCMDMMFGDLMLHRQTSLRTVCHLVYPTCCLRETRRF